MKSETFFCHKANSQLNDPKFVERDLPLANDVDPDQTAPGAVLSGSTLFDINTAFFGEKEQQKNY